jgi:DNA-binding beta-propeller fold protein YncE
MRTIHAASIAVLFTLGGAGVLAQTPALPELPKPYSPPCVERENVFAFTEKPQVKRLGNDQYEIAFAVKGNCDATVSIVDRNGVVVRHLASGVLGANAPAPFQKNSLRQTLHWDGKDDLGKYEKKPGDLQVRVQLGLNPVFDKRLGGTSPYKLAGQPFGIAIGESGVYVFSAGNGPRLYVRKFDHDGKYVESLSPPPSRHPEAKLQGFSYVEYEKGKKALHSRNPYDSIAGWGNLFLNLENGRNMIAGNQPVVIGDKLCYMNSGVAGPSLLHYVFTDGSVDLAGMKGILLQPQPNPIYASVKFPHVFPHMAASPDGRYLYYVSSAAGLFSAAAPSEVVWRKDLQAPDKPVEAFIGKAGEPGSDNAHLSSPSGIACDGAGRIYVADLRNNRIQIFTADGKHAATLPVERPSVVGVHPKTGVLYVLHLAMVQGRSVGRLTKFAAFDQPSPVFSLPESASYLAVDAWSARPRLWLAGAGEDPAAASASLFAGDRDFEKTSIAGGGDLTRILEDEGTTLKTVLNFGQRMLEDDGPMGHLLPFDGNMVGRKVFCDPVREQVYIAKGGKFVGDNIVYDLKTGQPLRSVVFPSGGLGTGELAFDKKGYLHVHFTPGFYLPGVGRVDPEQATPHERAAKDSPVPVVRFKEVPYDYGVAVKDWVGILPCRDQPGAKFYSDGVGVNMAGDVAEQANIYYAPKMDDAAGVNWTGGDRKSLGLWTPEGRTYSNFLKDIEERAKKGEETYFIKRRPGLPGYGPTIWTFAANGKLLQECAVVMSSLIEGAHLDEDRRVYFVNNAARAVNGTRFLNGRIGRYGEPDYKVGDLNFLQTGVLVKAGPSGARILMSSSPTPLDERPDRPPDVFPDGAGDTQPAWIEGAEWVYAGASPVVTLAAICSCPKQNFHLDWFKRSYVPEAYRHSIGILDTSGNLILHLGRFGNFDDAAKMGAGGDVIVTFNRFISGTDNYLVYEDYGERVVVLRLSYHAEAEASIPSANP